MSVVKCETFFLSVTHQHEAADIQQDNRSAIRNKVKNKIKYKHKGHDSTSRANWSTCGQLLVLLLPGW